MCGIAGIISFNYDLCEKDILQAQRMTEILRHRGPDDFGIVHDNCCVVGNTRLKIIDLSQNAHLPFENYNKTISLTYNGEITNFKELCEEFKLKDKYPFRSSSDAEVLLYLYEELGIRCLQYLSGMFAFCIYDKRGKKAYIVRDFYGMRPLFYMVKNNRLYFSSEIKSFLDIDCFNNTLDHEGIYHFFSLAYIPGVHTPFKDIKELEGGHLIEIDFNEKKWRQQEYYSIQYQPNADRSVEETAQELHEILKDSVRRNLISDSPLGLTLSGGFDTSTILALTKELGVSDKIHTFSIKINEKSFDETYYQKIMVDFARPIHHQITVNPDDVLPELISHMAYMDEPSGDGAAIPLFLLAKEAKKYVRVLLSGEGGDEIFNAYETHGAYAARKLYRRFLPRILRSCLRGIVNKLPVSYEKLSFDFRAKRFTEGAELDVPGSHLFWRHVLREKEKKLLLPQHSHYKSSDSLFRETYNNALFEEELDRLSLLDIEYFFIGDLMVKNDRMVMAHSIEARFPYMDRILFDFIRTIPVHMRVRSAGFSRRYIQKKAMQNHLPKAIMNRSNMGLEMPHSIWFLKELRPVIEKYFSKSNIEKTGIFDYKLIQSLWQQHVEGRNDYGRALWCILMFLIWFDLFVYNRDYKKYLN